MCVSLFICDVTLVVFVRHLILVVISARSTAAAAANPLPYQRGPPQEYLEAVTNKRLTEEVSGVWMSIHEFLLLGL